jgi:hypothetical protein
MVYPEPRRARARRRADGFILCKLRDGRRPGVRETAFKIIDRTPRACIQWGGPNVRTRTRAAAMTPSGNAISLSNAHFGANYVDEN